MEFLGINSTEAILIGLVGLVTFGPQGMGHLVRALVLAKRTWTKLQQGARLHIDDISQRVTHDPDVADLDRLVNASDFKDLQREIAALKRELADRVSLDDADATGK